MKRGKFYKIILFSILFLSFLLISFFSIFHLDGLNKFRVNLFLVLQIKINPFNPYKLKKKVCFSPSIQTLPLEILLAWLMDYESLTWQPTFILHLIKKNHAMCVFFFCVFKLLSI